MPDDFINFQEQVLAEVQKARKEKYGDFTKKGKRLALERIPKKD
jgi:hypothetical protein